MINSRDINDLHPKVKAMAEAFLSACEKNGLEVAIYSTYRDHESQNDLYSQGRTKPGKKVTNAKGGDSFHNWRVAFDAAPKVNGKINWDNIKLFTKMGEIGESVGLEWGGRWVRFIDRPHFQFTGGLTLKDFKEGKALA
jgi:peptidoglycan L-alanyl-D-glutamate endopeptidase CwlK